MRAVALVQAFGVRKARPIAASHVQQQLLMVAAGPSVLTARSGALSLQVNGVPYHSVYDPVREAEKFCAALRIEEADVIFLFGWGLGYLGSVLQPRIKAGARVIVFEPDSSLFDLSTQVQTTRIFEDKRFQFAVGEAARRFFDDWDLAGSAETDRFLWVEWPAAVALHPELPESLKSKFKTRLRDRAANLLTHFSRGSLYFENALANFRYQDSADVGTLFGRFPNIPLVLVSAGPSLDLNVEQLRGREDRCFILACDTALRPLLTAGVVPHAVILADPTDLNARHIIGALPESVWMIAEQAVKPAALESSQKRFMFGLGLFPDSLYAKYGFGKSTLDVWGSVATAALDLACRLGANPVIFAGQDFGFSWGREYTRHTVFHANTFSPELGGPLKEIDIWGNPIHTTENLVAYRDHFVRKMRQRPDIRFINATEGGILRESCEILRLRDVLAQLPETSLNIAGRLAQHHQPQRTSREALHHLRKVLKLRRRDCSCLTDFLELVAKEALLKRGASTQPAASAIDEKVDWGIRQVEKALGRDV